MGGFLQETIGWVLLKTVPLSSGSSCSRDTLLVNGRKIDINDDTWHEICGTEANELAMLMTRLYSGNLGIIALRNAYHGGSATTIGLTALNTWKYPIP
ncbi:alanine--glyoxylate aminotransferase 2 homolog 1, mitochondrial-like protein [Tanacetum coccineum]